VNSLQTGNFAGNFSELGPKGGPVIQETPEPRALLSKFPAQNIREITIDNRDFSAFSRENPVKSSSATPWLSFCCEQARSRNTRAHVPAGYV
jgi:hypothetical protein